MDSILRAVVTYLILFVLFRLSGKKTLGKSSPFELVLLLIISETTQEVLVDGDYSTVNMVILVATLIGMDILFSVLKYKSDKATSILDGQPLVLILDGKIQEINLKKARIRLDDIRESARAVHGIGNLDGIRHAILEVNGSISIIPANKTSPILN